MNPTYPTRTIQKAPSGGKIFIITIPSAQLFTQSFAASLSFVGLTTKKVIDSGFTAVLRFLAPPTPDQTSGLKGWWKADSLSLTDGASVTSWTDSSGGGLTVSQGTSGNQPIYKTNILNGLPIVRFDGTNDYLSSGSDISQSQPFTIFGVGKPGTSGTGAFQDIIGGSGNVSFGFKENSGNYNFLMWAGAALTDSVNYSGTFTLISGIFNGGSSLGYVNGVQKVSGDPGASSIGTLGVGGDGLGSGGFFNGDIAEAIIYNRALTSTERLTVESYLGWKYNITVTGAISTNPLTKKTFHGLSATLSFVGALIKKLIDSGFTATLSFVGSLTKKLLDAGFTATLSFVGSLVSSKAFNRAFTATLSFAGALTRQVRKPLTAALSFAAALTRKITQAGFTATLSFAGALIKKLLDSGFTATLSFVGSLGTQKAFNKIFTATLSFTGSLKAQCQKAFAATLSFSGALIRKTNKILTAGLSFVGNLATQLIHGGVTFTQSFTATLSFTGNLTKRLIDAGFTATLSFVGNLTKLLRDAGFAATLSFSGVLVALKAFNKIFTATLSFSGTLRGKALKSFSANLTSVATLTKKLIDSGFTATLSFVGFLGRGFPKSFTATLSFVGTLTRARFYARVFTATLSFTGALKRSSAKAFAASLSFVGVLTRRTIKRFTASISFIGDLFKGGVVNIWAGQVAGSTVKIAAAISSAVATTARSALMIFKTGSSTGTSRTGSDIDVDKTE